MLETARIDSRLQGSRPGRGGVMERTRAEDPPHGNPWRGSLPVLPHQFSRPPVSSEHHPSCSGVTGAEPSVRLTLLTRSATDSLDAAVTAPATRPKPASLDASLRSSNEVGDPTR